MSKAVVMMSWDDAAHLSDEDKAELLAECAPHQRDARAKGIPSMGAGAIYPVPESEIVCRPFPLPAYWPRLYGLDVGWKRTAAIWLAHDRSTDTVYAYAEHYRGQAEPSVHAAAIRARGAWVPGAIDPAARGRSQVDGKSLMDGYTDLGLDLMPADNAVEAGIAAVFERLSTGRLKVFSTLQKLLYEYRIYRRDEKGRVVKENDHAMDALRYACMGLQAMARTKPIPRRRAAAMPGDRTAGY
jgi:hypothetical protein